MRRWLGAVGGAVAVHGVVLASLWSMSSEQPSPPLASTTRNESLNEMRTRSTAIEILLAEVPSEGGEARAQAEPTPAKRSASPRKKGTRPPVPASSTETTPAQAKTTNRPAPAQDKASQDLPLGDPAPSDASPSQGNTKATGNPRGVSKTGPPSQSGSKVAQAGANGSTNSLARVRQAYSRRVRSKIAALKRYPERARRLGQSGRVVLVVAISGAGQTSATLRTSSGSPVLDREAMSMVKRAGKMPPPPGGKLSIRLPVDFR